MKVRVGHPLGPKATTQIDVPDFSATDLLLALFFSNIVPTAAKCVSLYTQSRHAQLYIDGSHVLTLERID